VSIGATYQFFYRLTTTAPVIVPITFGYAIARHRLLGVEVVLRRGLQYLLARNVLRIALWLPVLGLVYTFVSNADKTVAEVLLERSAYFYGFLIAAGLLSVKYRPQLTEWLDRKFFREAYKQEKILLALIDSLNSCESVPEISRLVCDRVDLALHPTVAHLFYRDPEHQDFTIGHSSSGDTAMAIPEDFAAISIMQDRSRVLDLPASGKDRLPPNEEQWFRARGVTILVAMKGADERLCGLVLLGDKKSEEPYSAGDRELLQAIAGQAAMVWENLWLKERMRREQQIRRDVLAHVDSRGINLMKECEVCGRCFDRLDEVCPDDRAPLVFTVPFERTLDNRYRLDRRLGRGGMGVVYEASDMRLRRAVAVKVLHGALFGAQDAMRRFEREARASGRISHGHVVRTYDYGVIGNDGAYLVMELLRGSTWRAELNRAGTLDPLLVASWLDQTLDGLEAAHQLGLIHRDLKPENLMICRGSDGVGPGVLKILDFGLAKNQLLQSDGDTTIAGLTVPGTLLGTYTYMSPEQLSGLPMDVRSDLFAVGVIAVESLTGERPFRGSTLSDLVRAVLHDTYQLAGDGPAMRRVDACLQKALAKDPKDRYGSAAAMRAELVPAVAAAGPIIVSTAMPLPPGDTAPAVR
jgi:eukaryotic-like serine/threonine-protein kinase